MASYATPQYFIDTFGEEEALELSQIDDPNAQTIDLAKIQRALDHATAEVMTYMAGQYELPLPTPIPTVLSYKTVVIARHLLDKNRRREDVRSDYEDVMAQLRDFATGKATLVMDDGSKVPDANPKGEQMFGVMGVGEGSQAFTDDSLGDFDRDLLYFGRR